MSDMVCRDRNDDGDLLWWNYKAYPQYCCAVFDPAVQPSSMTLCMRAQKHEGPHNDGGIITWPKGISHETALLKAFGL